MPVRAIAPTLCSVNAFMFVDAFMSASTSTPTLCFFGVQRCCLHGRLHVRGRRLADFVFLWVNAFMFMDDFHARARLRAVFVFP